MGFIENWLTEIWTFMKTSRIVSGVMIVVAFAAMAWLLDLVIDRVFVKLVRKSTFKVDDVIVKAVHRPLWITVLLVGVLISIQWMSPSPTFVTFSAGILKSLIIILWALAVNQIIVQVIHNWIVNWRFKGRQGSEIIGLGGNITRILILIAAVFIFLSIWKIDITPLMASAGIAGLAVALAAKETLSNFFGGVSVMMDQPYKVGDYIILDSGERGEVIEIGLRSTRILTRDDIMISIPNSIITNTKIVNESAPEPRFRVRVKVGVAYGSDIDRVEAVLLSVADKNPLLASEPKSRVRFRNFGDSSLDFELLCWAQRPHDKGKVIHMLNCSIYRAFHAEGIVIPFPQRDVHIISHNE